MLMQYSSHLRGVPIGYENIQLDDAYGKAAPDSAFLHFYVRVSMYLFEPREGTVLMGTVNKVGSDHIGLLVEGTWNASIPRSMIPDQYEFDQELGVWCDKDFDHPHIDAGCAIPFVVTDTEVMGEVLSINGSLKDVNQLASAYIQTPLKTPRSSLTQPALSPKKATTSKKKRKRSEEPDSLAPETPSAEGEVVRNGDGSVATAVEQPKKKKKKAKAKDGDASGGKAKKKKKKRLSETAAN